MIELIKTHQQKIALAVAFAAVGALGYFGGQSINSTSSTKTAKPSLSTSNYTQSVSGAQTQIEQKTPVVETDAASSLNCQGKIKGTSSMIYHLPEGAFYKRVTNPIRCFDTEAQAQTAGFRKSSR